MLRITKVKGHATEAQVEQGLVHQSDKEGNDKADRAATYGVEEQIKGSLTMSAWLGQRQKAYIALMEMIQKMTVAVILEKQLIDEETDKENKEGKPKEQHDAIVLTLGPTQDEQEQGSKMRISKPPKGTA